jgi:hypothetical protein
MVMANPTAKKYQAYLLRLWRESSQQTWRAMLEDPHTGDQRAFATLEQLFTYLQQQTQVTPAKGDKHDSPKRN